MVKHAFPFLPRFWRELKSAPKWQRWCFFYSVTCLPPLFVFVHYGFWWAMLLEAVLAWPQDHLLRQLVLAYPLPAFIKRLENKGKAMRAEAEIAHKTGKRS